MTDIKENLYNTIDKIEKEIPKIHQSLQEWACHKVNTLRTWINVDGTRTLNNIDTPLIKALEKIVCNDIVRQALSNIKDDELRKNITELVYTIPKDWLLTNKNNISDYKDSINKLKNKASKLIEEMSQNKNSYFQDETIPEIYPLIINTPTTEFRFYKTISDFKKFFTENDYRKTYDLPDLRDILGTYITMLDNIDCNKFLNEDNPKHINGKSNPEVIYAVSCFNIHLSKHKSKYDKEISDIINELFDNKFSTIYSNISQIRHRLDKDKKLNYDNSILKITVES